MILNESLVGNKQFCKTIMTLISNKTKYSEKIMLEEGDKIFAHDAKKQKFGIPFSQTQLKS